MLVRIWGYGLQSDDGFPEWATSRFAVHVFLKNFLKPLNYLQPPISDSSPLACYSWWMSVPNQSWPYLLDDQGAVGPGSAVGPQLPLQIIACRTPPKAKANFVQPKSNQQKIGFVPSFCPTRASLAPSPCRRRLEGTQPRVAPQVREPIGEMHPGSLVHLIPGPRIFRSARVTRNGLAEFTRPRRLSVENFFSPSSVFPKMVARPLTYQNLTALSIACHTA